MSIYFIQKSGDDLIKIGYTHDINLRLKQLQRGAPGSFTLLAVIEGGPIVESYLHQKFDHLNEWGEWFRPGQELLEFINSPTTVKLPFEQVTKTGKRPPAIQAVIKKIELEKKRGGRLHLTSEEARRVDEFIIPFDGEAVDYQPEIGTRGYYGV